MIICFKIAKYLEKKSLKMRSAYFLFMFLMPIAFGFVFTPREESAIIDFVQNVMECRNIPGLTLSVVKGNRTWTHGFGFADIKTRRKVTDETLFNIGSLGKAFTMALLGNLIQESGYSWNTRLSDIKGVNLQFIDEEITREATLSDLLSHRTGLSSVNDYGFIGGYPDAVTRKFLSKRSKFIPKAAEFRKSFLYNNMMYMLLGYVSEVLGKDSWENLVMSRVFKPIGMSSTKVMLTPADVLEEDTARPYIMPGDKLEDGNFNIYRLSPLEPAGTVLSNAVDMAKWMKFNLQGGSTYDGQQLLRDSLLEEAFQAHNPLPYGGILQSMSTPKYPINDKTTAYGYAWFNSTYRGFRRVWHSGGLFSYVSLIWLFPDQHVGVFASVNGPKSGQAANSPGIGLKTILSYISDVLLKQTAWLNPQTACSFPSPWVNSSMFEIDVPVPDNFTNDRLEDFVGTYGNYLLPDITISVKENNQSLRFLWLEMNRIQGELLLTADQDKFRFKMVNPWEYAIEQEIMGVYITFPVNFTRSAHGEVESFNLTFGEKEIMKYKQNITLTDDIRISMAQCHHISLNLMLFFLSLAASG